VDLCERVEASEGRRLTRREIEGLAEADERAELLGEDEIDASALYDLDTSDGISAYIGDRLAGPPEGTEPTANVIGEDGSSTPGYDVDTAAGREALMDARLRGEDATSYDGSFTTIETEGDE
jgi:hypothetical protein